MNRAIAPRAFLAKNVILVNKVAYNKLTDRAKKALQEASDAAEKRGWKTELIDLTEGTAGGFKEAIVGVKGEGAFGMLRFEAGGHRVQRVPATESQGRIHTSACTVAVIPEPDEVEAEEINPADLRIDVYRASGAGGQHACRVADALGMESVFIHPFAGVLSAYGMGLADQRVMHERAMEKPLDDALIADMLSAAG